MSAFKAYGGAYEHEGRPFIWRCYATARVLEVRASAHIPKSKPPRGFKWVRRSRHKGDEEFGWLVEAPTDGFSHILLQVEPARHGIQSDVEWRQTASA